MTKENRDRLIREALYYAIASLAEDQARRGWRSESAQLAAWREVLRELEQPQPADVPHADASR